MDGKFPDYESCIPNYKESQVLINIQPKAMIGALESLMAHKPNAWGDYKYVRLLGCNVKGYKLESKLNNEPIEVDVEGVSALDDGYDNENRPFAYNYKYMLNLLKPVPINQSFIQWIVDGVGDPGSFTYAIGDGREVKMTAVIMPVRWN